ncbi:hypothetical protein [Olivibacter ginsenosidimutans]
MALFFRKKQHSNNANAEQREDIVSRLQVFLARLDEKAKLLYDEAKESAQSIADADPDPFKRSYYQFKTGIQGQFQALLQKANTTYQSQVLPKANMFEQMKVMTIFAAWHSNFLHLMTDVFEGVQLRDLEKEYREIMDDYTLAKEKFHCSQCGGKLEIDQFYYISTYITCPYCKTQNTFHPGTKTRLLELIARDLAEYRHRDLKENYQKVRREYGVKEAEQAFKSYMRAVIDEMNRIQPGMEIQNDRFYERIIEEYTHHGIG